MMHPQATKSRPESDRTDEMTATGTITNLFHYPVKGLSAQPLQRVDLEPGKGFPLDRAFGFARPNSGFDPDNPRPLPKTKFVVLARDAGLALLDTRYDPDTKGLSIKAKGQEAEFDTETEDGRMQAAAFIASALDLPEDMQPTLYSAQPHRFTDVSVVSPEMMNAISLINADSCAAFSDKVGQDVSPMRFRGNIVFTGLAPFSELDLVGKQARIGEAEIRFVQRTRRCPATQVNLETGERDLDVPRLLRDHYGHSDLGIYAEVLQGGRIAPGDTLQLSQ